MTISLIAAAIFPALLIFAAASDLFTFTIPNALVAALTAAFPAIAFMAGFSCAEIASHLLCGLAMLGAGFLFFSRGWVGGGDAKLFAAIALWLGWGDLAAFALYVAVIGGCLTLLILIFRYLPVTALFFPAWLLRLRDRGEGVPYGIALSAAGIIVYSNSFWMAVLLSAI